MLHEALNFNSSFNDFQTNGVLLQEREEKNCFKEIDCFLDKESQFDVLEKNVLDFYRVETDLCLLLEKGTPHSLYDWLRSIKGYNEILISLKKFEDAFFVASILKRTKLLFK